MTRVQLTDRRNRLVSRSDGDAPAGVAIERAPVACAPLAFRPPETILGSMAVASRAGERLPRDGWPALVGGLAGCFALVLAASIAGGFLLRLVEGPDGSTRVDSWITERLIAHRTDALTSLAQGVSRVGSTSVLLPVVVIVAGLLVWRHRVVLAGLLVVAWAGSIGLYDVTKAVVDRPRPPAGIRLATAAGASFPSGHATQSLATYAALAVVVAAVWRPARFAGWFAASVIVLGVGWARVYLGMHWATDVVAGWLIGAAWLALITLVVARRVRGPGRHAKR